MPAPKGNISNKMWESGRGSFLYVSLTAAAGLDLPACRQVFCVFEHSMISPERKQSFGTEHWKPSNPIESKKLVGSI